MKKKPDLTNVLEHYGIDTPTRDGWTKIKCPIHDDTHASAACNLDEQLFTCFACDVNGDVYTLIMAKEQIGFRDAVKFGETHFNGSMRQVHATAERGLLGVPSRAGHSSGSRGFLQAWHRS